MLDKIEKLVYICNVNLLDKEIMMEFQERSSFIELFDIYGNLLSERQKYVMDKFLNLDVSESEIAEIDGESRQSVHDAIVKAKKQLKFFEESCEMAKKFNDVQRQLLILKSMIKENNIEKSTKIIDDILKQF